MKYATIALTCLLGLTSCANKPIKYESQTLTLPDVVEYTPAQYKAAVKEAETYCPYMPVICGLMMADYKVMRDQTRAAQ